EIFAPRLVPLRTRTGAPVMNETWPPATETSRLSAKTSLLASAYPVRTMPPSRTSTHVELLLPAPNPHVTSMLRAKNDASSVFLSLSANTASERCVQLSSKGGVCPETAHRTSGGVTTGA